MNFPKTIDQLWLFGSHARGNFDERSDVDILMISDSDDTNYVTEYFAGKYVGKIDVSHYSYVGLLPLINKGSLFASHLKKEAIPLFQRSKKLKNLLNEMPNYCHHIADLKILKLLVEDVKLSLREKNNTFVFDAGVLGTAIRNTAIILCNYLNKDDYSPWAPLKLGSLEYMLALPISEVDYKFLQECRRLGERGGVVENKIISPNKLTELVNYIEDWQHNCVNYISQKEAA